MGLKLRNAEEESFAMGFLKLSGLATSILMQSKSSLLPQIRLSKRWSYLLLPQLLILEQLLKPKHRLSRLARDLPVSASPVLWDVYSRRKGQAFMSSHYPNI